MRGRMKLGTRLVCAFAAVSLAAIGAGAYGIIGMRSIASADRFLYEKATEPMGLLIAMTKGFQRMRIGLRDAMDASTREGRDAALLEAQAQSEKVQKSAAEFGKNLATGNGSALFASFEAARKDYDAVFDKIMSLHGQGKDADVAALMKGAGKEAADAEQTAIDALVEAKIAYAKGVASDNTRLCDLTALIMLAALAAVLLLGVAVALVITRSITRAVGGEPEEIAAVADRVALGDLSIELDGADRMTGIQRSLAGMVGSLKAKSAALKTIAEGDLSTEVALASDRDEVGISLRAMLSSLNDLVSQVTLSIEQVAAGTEQVSQTAEALSEGATEQAASIEEISASLVEISGQTRQNSESALQMNGLAKASRDKAAEGNGRMKELVAAMADINRSSEDVKKIVKAIDDIAFQINLLALNANVEAARAGKYGKGFAVVADEVRSLAVRSAEAVKEATRMVEGSIASIGRGDELVRLTALRLEEISEGSAKVSDIADEVATASAEQSRGIEQINSGVEQIDQVTQGNTASAEEAAAASEELASQAQQLKEMVGRFTLRKIDEAQADAGPELSPELVERLLRELSARGLTLSASRGGTKADVAIKPVARSAAAAKTRANDGDFGEF